MFKLVLLALADQARDTAAGEPCGKNAVRLAGAVAARHGAGFAALQVSGPISQENGCVLQLPGEDVLAQRRLKLEALLREVMPPGLTADVLSGAGFAHVEILKAARVLGPDLLVLGGLDETERCRQELSAAQSSAAQLVAINAPCPVLAVAAAAEVPAGPFERVLVAVTLSDDDIAPARHLLCFAARLAAREGAELHVLHALPLPPGQPTPSQEEMVRRIASVRGRLDYLCHGLPGADRFAFCVSEGSASVEILKQARERKADLLVLGVQGKGQGPTSSRVLVGARCPVLLLGPGVLVAQMQKNVQKSKG